MRGKTLEIRAGFTIRNLPGKRPALLFAEPTGGSLFHQRATDARIQEQVPESDPQAPGGIPVRTLRLTTNIMGDRFVEGIPDEDILGYQLKQPDHLRGTAIPVAVAVQAKGPDGKPVLVERIGRFGWKRQLASVLNFAAGAYLNEMGITSLLNMDENLSRDGKGNVRFVGAIGNQPSEFDPRPEPEDKNEHDDDNSKPDTPFGADVEAFTRFTRSLTMPPQAIPDGANPADAKAGEALFGTDGDNDGFFGFFGTPKGTTGIGCFQCHRVTFTTPGAGTFIHMLGAPDQAGSDIKDLKDPNAKPSTVPAALGGRRIFPYSDFLLHDIGTGDGITQQHHAENPPTNFKNRRPMLTPQVMEALTKDPGKKYKIVDIERQTTPAAATRPSPEELNEPGRLMRENPALPPAAVTGTGPADLDQSVRNMIRTARCGA